MRFVLAAFAALNLIHEFCTCRRGKGGKLCLVVASCVEIFIETARNTLC
jgi:hypothetical protein